MTGSEWPFGAPGIGPGEAIFEVRFTGYRPGVLAGWGAEFDGQPMTIDGDMAWVRSTPGLHELYVWGRAINTGRFGELRVPVQLEGGQRLVGYYNPPVHIMGQGTLTPQPAKRSWAMNWTDVRERVLQTLLVFVLVGVGVALWEWLS